MNQQLQITAPTGSPDQHLKKVEQALDMAKRLGADQSEVNFSNSTGFTVQVRRAQVDTLEYQVDQNLTITVYRGRARGSASTSDLSDESIQQTVQAAFDIARFTSEDPAAGLADATLMARDVPNLDLCTPWAITPEEAIQEAMRCEGMGLGTDVRLKNSEGASLATHLGFEAYGNSHGFLQGYASSMHSLSLMLIAESLGVMERDYSYTYARDPAMLWSPSRVAVDAAKRTLDRLNARQLSTMQVPVLFVPDVASGLLRLFLSAISGSRMYRKTTFLLDHLGKRVFPERIHVRESPHLLKGLASSPFDADGLATYAKDFIQDGNLVNYVLGTYSGRKLGMPSTANAGGVSNMAISHDPYDFEGLMRLMHRGLVVTEVMGDGVNLTTGDYSQGVTGFWVENGERQFPVHEITVAGRLQDMFHSLVAVGSDVDPRLSIQTGSWLVEGLTIAGA